MTPYIKCRFCGGELKKLQTKRNAFCNAKCKKFYRLYGNVKQLKDKSLIDKALKEQPVTTIKRQPKAQPKHTVIVLGYGETVKQAALILDYPDD